MSIDTAYRAALVNQQNLKRESDKLGPHLYEFNAEAARPRQARRWFAATGNPAGAGLRAMLATMECMRRPAACSSGCD